MGHMTQEGWKCTCGNVRTKHTTREECIALWEKRSNAAMQAKRTKMEKYTTWPTRRNDHEER